jgi:hypothetical protein
MGAILEAIFAGQSRQNGDTDRQHRQPYVGRGVRQ